MSYDDARSFVDEEDRLCVPWHVCDDPLRCIDMLTVDELRATPEGTVLGCIVHPYLRVKGIDYLDENTRLGRTGFGYIICQLCRQPLMDVCDWCDYEAFTCCECHLL